MSNEKLRIDYRHIKDFFETPLNAVGATPSLTLRTGLAVPGGGGTFVKKFGTVYGITDLLAGCVINTPRSDGGGVNRWNYLIFGTDPTTGVNVALGRLTDANGVSAFTDFGTLSGPATNVFIELTLNAGTTAAIVDGDTLTLDTDVDPIGGGGLAVRIPAETIVFAPPLAISPWVFISSSGSTYYDAGMTNGGFRHTSVVGSSKFPYWDIQVALTAAAPTSVIEILDSETYDIGDGVSVINPDTIQSSLGQTPTITSGVGQRVSRTVFGSGGLGWTNSARAIYVNENGNDANTGTYHNPKLTIANAMAAAAGLSVIYGGIGATVAGGLFTENIFFGVAVLTFEPEIGLLPQLLGSLTFANANNECRGWLIRADVTSTVDINIFDCTVDGGTIGATDSPMTVRRCEVMNVLTGIQIFNPTAAHNMQVLSNRIHDCHDGILVGAGAGTPVVQLEDNIIHDCINGYFFARELAGNITNGVVFNVSGSGVRDGSAPQLTAAITNMIFHTCGRYGIESDLGSTGGGNTFFNMGIANSINYANLGDPDQTADPRLVAPTVGRFGLAADSPCLEFTAADEDTGPLLRLFTIGDNNIIIDGIIFDGQSDIFNAIKMPRLGFTGLTVKWVTCIDTGGVAVDLFNTVALSATLRNLLFDTCGGGIRCVHGTNTYTEIAIFDSFAHGIWIDEVGHTLTHISTLGGSHGILIEANAATIVIRDSIFSDPSLFAVFSEVPINLTWSCVDGPVNANVAIDLVTSLLVTPFYIDTNEGQENLRLRTIEGGFPFDSFCVDVASDGFDMGAYLFARGITDETWETFVADENPRLLPESVQSKNEQGFENVLGDQKRSATSHRRRFSLQWVANSGLDKPEDDNPQRKFVELISSLIETEENLLRAEETTLRIHFRPIEYIHPGTLIADLDCTTTVHGTADTGVVDADDDNILVATGNFVRNEFKGYHATIRWTALIVNGVVDAVAKTLTSAGAFWTVDEWIGYWVRQGEFYFRVLSNTSTVLTLSDPFDHLLTVASGFEFYIQSSHKVLRNDLQRVYLDDADSLLRDGTFEWFIDFIVMRLTSSSIKILRNFGYREDQPGQKVPSRLDLEEAGLCDV